MRVLVASPASQLPWTMAAPDEASPNVISLTIVFSSTIAPHASQKAFPDDGSDSILPPAYVKLAISQFCGEGSGCTQAGFGQRTIPIDRRRIQRRSKNTPEGIKLWVYSRRSSQTGDRRIKLAEIE